jgi:hypothetical protein
VTAPDASAETAVEAEATGNQLRIEWSGQTILMPATMDDWDVDVLDAFENRHAVKALRLLFGPKRFDEIKAGYKKTTGKTMSVAAFNELSTEVAKAYGFLDSGE